MTKILICGLGSIGERHAQNLLNLGYHDLIVYRFNNRPIRNKSLSNLKIYTNIKKALQEKPSVAFICNTTHKHMDTSIICAKSGIHLFIEKPISNNLKKIKKLEYFVKKNKLKVMVGYMMRFHPLMMNIKKIIKNKELGKIYNARFEWSEYLPDWHPWENYRKSYAARKELGGGCNLTLSHELDLSLWLFGKVAKVYNIGTSKLLKLNTESVSDYLIKFKNSTVAYIHLDYLQKPYQRTLELVGDKKKLKFDYYKNLIIITDRKGNFKKYKIKFKKNDMFINEIKYFFMCLEKNKDPEPSLNESKYLLKNFIIKS